MLRRSAPFALLTAVVSISTNALAQAPAPAPSPALAPEAAPAPAPAPVVALSPEKLEWLSKFKVSGYLQPQLLWQWYDEAASPNAGANGLPAGIGPNYVTAKTDGTTTNPDYFRLRRARLKTEFTPTEGARFVMEIDPVSAGGPSGGIGTIARQVEAVGIVKWPGGFATTELAAGIFKIPFGYEVLQSDADRPFIERSWSEQNVTPGEFDTGFRAYTSMFEKKLNIQLAVVNGQIQGEKNFAVLPDLNKGKDLVGRINYNFGPFDIGASGMVGSGQVIDAATQRFKQFNRWAYNVEAALHAKLLPVGQTRVFAEVTRAQNYDRGTKYGFGLPVIPADLVHLDVQDLDELGYFVRLEQDITEWLTIAGRYDYYTPDSAQGNNGRDTFGAVAVVHFTKNLQWMAEYDHMTDNAHNPYKAGPAPSKHIDFLSNVLQVRF